MLETTVAEVRKYADGVNVRLEGDDLQEPAWVFNQVIAAVGRRPDTAGIGLEAQKLRWTKRD